MINPIIGGGGRRLLERVDTLENNDITINNKIVDLSRKPAYYNIVRTDYAGNWLKAIKDDFVNIPNKNNGICMGMILVGSVFTYICSQVDNGTYASFIVFTYLDLVQYIYKAGDAWTQKTISMV